MWTNQGPSKYRKLSSELLFLLCISATVAGIFYYFLSSAINFFATNYYTNLGFTSYEVIMQVINITPWIGSISLGISVFLFVFLFLFLSGQKLLYLEEIIKGVEMLRTKHMEYNVPIEGNNELTKLAESINYLAKVERELKEKENHLHQERELLIRSLSHDIRTPLTSIMSYSEYLSKKGDDYPEEIKEYLSLMNKKGMQIKLLTNQLLDKSERQIVFIENGKYLIRQLIDEFEDMLGEDYPCSIDLSECPFFQGEFCIQDFQRITDNLISNIHKYAKEGSPISLKVYEENGRLVLSQKNKKKKDTSSQESFKIGLESIRRIAEGFGGRIKVLNGEHEFQIIITLFYVD